MHSECQGSNELVWSSSLVEVEVKVELVCQKVVLMEGRKIQKFLRKGGILENFGGSETRRSILCSDSMTEYVLL